MNIVLTGATGFLGRHLMASLSQAQHKIFAIKRKETPCMLSPQEAAFVSLIDAQSSALIEVLTHHSIDVVIHAATAYGRTVDAMQETFQVNEVFAMTLLEQAAQKKVPLFINIDTFFNRGISTHYDYLPAYTLSKRHFQEWGKLYGESGRIQFINVRLFHLYGPGDQFSKFIPHMAQQFLSGNSVDLTDGKQKRDFIHVDDAISGILTLLHQHMQTPLTQAYWHYDLGTGKSICIRDFLETLERLCGKQATLNFGAIPTRKGEFLDACANISALEALGWQPKINLHDGIATLIEDIKLRLLNS